MSALRFFTSSLFRSPHHTTNPGFLHNKVGKLAKQITRPLSRTSGLSREIDADGNWQNKSNEDWKITSVFLHTIWLHTVNKNNIQKKTYFTINKIVHTDFPLFKSASFDHHKLHCSPIKMNRHNLLLSSKLLTMERMLLLDHRVFLKFIEL